MSIVYAEIFMVQLSQSQESKKELQQREQDLVSGSPSSSSERSRTIATSAVHIPSNLVDRISARLPKTDFKSVDDYVSYVLNEVLDELETSDQTKPESSKAAPSEVFTKEDQEDVEQRLKDLGYM